MTDTLMAPGARANALILASGSATRAEILKNAGIAFKIDSPSVDEASVRRSMIESGAPVEAGASRLADLKALEVSARQQDALVIGADQILECNHIWFEKPDSLEMARKQLEGLSGKRHRLISGVSVARAGVVIWRHTDEAIMVMRPLGGAFLDQYIKTMAERLFNSVGGYQIEGLGAQLFDSVEGDHYTVLGLPLLPLLGFLRENELLGT